MLRILFTSVFLISNLHGSAQEWALRKQKDGVDVYTKPIAGSSFDAFKAVLTVEGEAAVVRNILQNCDRYSHIFPDTEELRILERNGSAYLIQYSRTAAPWPVDDRDGIYEMKFINTANGGFETKSRALPNHLPEVDGVVRIKKSNSFWRVIPTDGNLLQIEYEVMAEPGGSIPDWLANSAITEIPIGTMNNLRNEIEKQR